MSYDLSTNYCPQCGQENNHNQLSFATIVQDFFHNYLSFDSKFTNSLLPFFFRPGKLTRLFVEGKRMSYVHPIRLYLIISLVFFFFFNMLSRDYVYQAQQNFDNATEPLQDSTLTVIDSLVSASLDSAFAPQASDSLNDLELVSLKDTIKISGEDSSVFSSQNIDLYLELRQDKNRSAEEILDSLQLYNLSPYQEKFLLQCIKTDLAPTDLVVSQIMKNLPLMIMLIIPAMALVLKLLYAGRKEFYFTHIIHLLHLHSFVYLLYSVAALFMLYYTEHALTNWVMTFAVLLANLYCYLSMKNVYRDSWIKTFFKFVFLGMTYFWALTFAFMIEFTLSILTI